MTWYNQTGMAQAAISGSGESEKGKKKKGKGFLSRSEEHQLGKRIQSGDEEALEALVLANLSLVVSLAKKYSSLGLQMEDLVSEGTLSLVKAARKFDPERGTRFSTYAVWSVRRAMIKAVVEQRGVVNLPYHKSSLLFRINRMKHKMAQERSAPVSLEQVAEEAEIPLKQVENVSMAAGHYTSLDAPIDNENDDELYALCEQTHPSNPFDKAQKVEDSYRVKKAIEQLPEREKSILTMHYGLDGNTEMTFVEIGLRMGLSRQRVQQIERRAVSRLQNELGLN